MRSSEPERPQQLPPGPLPEATALVTSPRPSNWAHAAAGAARPAAGYGAWLDAALAAGLGDLEQRRDAADVPTFDVKGTLVASPNRGVAAGDAESSPCLAERLELDDQQHEDHADRGRCGENAA